MFRVRGYIAVQQRIETLDEDISAISVVPARTAFFFDFDGTLAEIVDDPAAVSIGAEVLDALATLRDAAGGALAVISGREISALDRFLAPLELPLGGAHGSERRNARGEVESVGIDAGVLAGMVAELQAFARGKDGLIVEPKRTSVALHYRRNPALEEDCRAVARGLAEKTQDTTLLEGKMVVELKLSGRTKGDLIAAFMDEPPFAGRRPIFFGDDVTDEDGFRALPRWGGIGVKIGDGETAAQCRMRDPAELHDWLARQASMGGAERTPAGT